MEGGLISDGVLAQDINQASSFWRIREVPILIPHYFHLITISDTANFINKVLTKGSFSYIAGCARSIDESGCRLQI